MKVRIPSQQQINYNKVREAISTELTDARKDERDKTVRRMVKILCLVLHEKRGFGKQRLAETVNEMAEQILKGIEFWDNDVGDFWYKVDKTLEQYGINFYPTEDELVFRKKDDVGESDE